MVAVSPAGEAGQSSAWTCVAVGWERPEQQVSTAPAAHLEQESGPRPCRGSQAHDANAADRREQAQPRSDKTVVKCKVYEQELECSLHTKDLPPYPVLSLDSGFWFLFLMPLFSFLVLAKCFMEVAEEGKRNLCRGNSWRDPDRPLPLVEASSRRGGDKCPPPSTSTSSSPCSPTHSYTHLVLPFLLGFQLLLGACAPSLGTRWFDQGNPIR